MSLQHVDLNLLVYLDVLLREKNVSRAAAVLGITQPAMSNILRRLRKLLGDPLLLRGSNGMVATEYALSLQPKIHEWLKAAEVLLIPRPDFRPYTAKRVFRIMTSDYAEACLVPRLVKALRSEAPNIVLDFLTPSDVSYIDMEQGKVDMAINHFNEIPQSFHQALVWRDSYSCLFSAQSDAAHKFNLRTYLDAKHVWVNKTGMGMGFGVQVNKTANLGAVDSALKRLGKSRDINVYTRHYQLSAMLLTNKDLIATLPTRIARLQADGRNILMREPPFFVPSLELYMAWSPLLHDHPAHKWLRALILHVAGQIVRDS